MSILVTGGAGFIGSHLMDRLVEQGREVVCLDDFNDHYDPRLKRRNIEGLVRAGRIRLYEGDIRDTALCGRILEKEGVDTVVHVAARAGVRDSLERPMLYQDVNCGGTQNLLELSRRNGVKKFVFASSSSVYGGNTKVPFSEDDHVGQPVSPYAATKRACELFCHAYHHLYGIPMVCLRFFTVYGPRGRPEMAISKFTRLIHAGEPVPMFGDGTSSRDYTFYSDIIQGVVAAIDADLEFEIINLGESKVIALRDMIALIEKALARKARIEQLPEQPGDVPMTHADISKARRLLGYNPSFPIEKGIPIYVDWYLRAAAKLS